jgi:hypothetical protein
MASAYNKVIAIPQQRARRRMDSGERSEVLAVAERFMTASNNEVVTYDDLSRAAGCDVRDTRRWIILRAIKLISKTSGVVFANERGVGYRRLDSETGVKHAGEKAIKRTRSAARHGRQNLQHAVQHANDVSPSEQRYANQRLAALGLVEHLTKAKVVRTMPDETPKPLDDLVGLRKVLGL